MATTVARWTAKPTYGELERVVTANRVVGDETAVAIMGEDGRGTSNLTGDGVTDPITLGTATGAKTITVGVGTGIQTINVGTNAAANVVTIGSLTGAASTTIQAGTGGLTLTGVLLDTETVITTVDPAPAVIETGKLFFLDTLGTTTVTLPAPAAGMRFEFLVTVASTEDVTIDCGAGLLRGQVYASSGGDEDSGVADRNIIFTDCDGAGQIGDSCVITSDGTNWFAKCFCDVTAGITFS